MILLGILIGSALATFAWAIVFVLLAAHRAPPTTKHGRRELRGYQPLPHTRLDPPPMPRCKPARDHIACPRRCSNRIAVQGEVATICAEHNCGFLIAGEPAREPMAEVGGLRYEHLGMTGEEM